MPEPSPELDVDLIAADVAAEYQRQVEMHHQAMYQAALGMDQRAAVLGAAFLAAAGGVAAGMISASTPPTWLVWAGGGAGTLLMIAAGCCIYACRPQPYTMPGITPENWHDQDFLGRPLPHIRLGWIKALTPKLELNEQRQRLNGRVLLAGFCLAALAPIWAAMAFALGR